jgi:PKD repeat protein
LPGLDVILIDFGLGPYVTNTFSFSAGSIAVDENGVLAYKWLFGDGSMAQGKVVTHSYPAGGVYTITLTIVTTNGIGEQVHLNFFTTITVISQIAFIDEDSFGEDTIYIINADGTGLATVAAEFDLPLSDMDEGLDMNAFGQIVYDCTLAAPPAGADTDQLCVVNADGTGNKILTSDPNEAEDARINDLGQIVYECEDGSGTNHVCVVNYDGTGRKRLTFSSQGFEATDAEINNLGQIAFDCEYFASPAPGVDDDQMCGVNSDGTNVHRITSDPNGVFDAEINDLGQVGFECEDLTFDLEICVVNFNGGAVTQLTDGDCCTDFFDVEMNQTGKVAFQCELFGAAPLPSPGASPFQKCVVSTSGSSITVTPDNAFIMGPHEYSGNKIVAACSNDFFFTEDLCVFNDSGTSFLKLVDDLVDLEDFAIR